MPCLRVFGVKRVKRGVEMIKLLATTRCGIIATRLLTEAYYDGNRYVTAMEIATHYNMSVRSLMSALNLLNRAGLLRSRVGGKTPGFIFSRDPREISAFELLMALEGESSTPCCKDVLPHVLCDCGKSGTCRIFLLFKTIHDSIKEKASKISVAQIAQVDILEKISQNP